MTLTDLIDIGIAICVCADFLNEHGDDGRCLVCDCLRFEQDQESDTFYLEGPMPYRR